MVGTRQFFALWPDAATRESLVRVQQGLDIAGGRRVHALDLHLTLAFLGDVEAARADCVLAAAGRVHGAPVELSLDRLGAWSGPRVAWLGASATPAPLSDLVDQLWAGLATCGFRREARDYRPHVTLLRKCGGLPAAALPSPLRWRADAFVLAESQPAPTVPRYRIVRRWPLAAAAGGYE